MKRIKFILMSFILIPILFGCGGNNTVKVSTNGDHCTFENKTKTVLNKDFSIGVTADTGYELSSNCFNIKVKNNDITAMTNYWTYSNNSLSIKKDCIIGDISIVANANKIIKNYNVAVTASGVSAYEPFPSTCISNKDLIVKFNLDNQSYGINCSVKINNVDYNGFELRNSTDYSYLKIKSDDLNGDVVINILASEGLITLSQTEIKIHNYDTTSVFYYSPLEGTISITPSTSTSAFSITHNPSNNEIIIDSNSDDICSEIELLVTSSSGGVGNKILVSVYHPTNVQEALDAVTLGFMRGNTDFYITFDYDNNETFTEFCDHLEIIENMYDLIGGNYSTGKRQNAFALSPSTPHGHTYATEYTIVESNLYRQLNCANSIISKNECSGKTSTLALNKSNKTIKVYNSEELFWAVEHGYLPTFDTSTPAGSNAKTIYDTACKAVIANTTDEMSITEECINLFNYLENLITYDYTAAKSSVGYPEWLKYPAYFLEGVFLNNGIAVCDGFSKAYALLCGLDCLPVVRSFGYSTAGGHAWNYANIDGSWYLICPTWAKTNFASGSMYTKQFSVFTYDSFAKSRNYFSDSGGSSYAFSDLAFPLITKSIINSTINPLSLSKFVESLSSHNFVVEDTSDLTSIFNKCKSLSLGKTSYYLYLDASALGSVSNFKTCVINALSSSGLSKNNASYYCFNDSLSTTVIFFN